MPTKKLKIDGGLEYSPTNGVDSGVKLHNFTVGTDGSLYKLPIFKNLKSARATKAQEASGSTGDIYFLSRFLDIKKFQTTALEDKDSVDAPPEYIFSKDLFNLNLFRRFVFLTNTSYGVLNIDYQGEVVLNASLPDKNRVKYSNFEHVVSQFVPDNNSDPQEFDLTSLNPKILVDFNSQYESDSSVVPSLPMRAIFPAQRMKSSRKKTGYDLLILPRNIISCSIDPTDPDIKYLLVKEGKKATYRDKNDLAKGVLLIGNRVVFYSTVDNAMYFSNKNDFSSLLVGEMGAEKNVPYKIRPAEEIQAIEQFNGNIITFTPSGMERWVVNDNSEDKLISRDASFHFNHRIRFSGSVVNGGDGNLYYYTDDFHVYRLTSNLKVESLLDGTLPEYMPIEDFLVKNNDLPMSAFKMFGWHFVSIGPWLYNIDSGTWSTYSIDGWKNVNLDHPTREYIWENTTTKRTISCGFDDIICTYNTICRALSYKEMQEVDLSDQQEVPCLNEGKYQWGDIAFFTTRVFRDEQIISLDAVFLLVRGIVPRGSKIWMKVIPGSSNGDFDINDESTYGTVSVYEPMQNVNSQDDVVAKFCWKGHNFKTDRFRLQFVTKEIRGFIVQAVFANLATISGSGEKIINNVNMNPRKEEEAREEN